MRADIDLGREWDGPAALPPPTAQSAWGACQEQEHHYASQTTVHAVTAIGIDMGKNTLHMVGLNSRGAIVLREKVSRGRIASRLSNVPPCLIGIEAGMATHYVARELALVPPVTALEHLAFAQAPHRRQSNPHSS